MDIQITPSKLRGSINNLQSKSYAHRLIIASALSNDLDFENIDLSSDDVKATANGLKKLLSKNHKDITLINACDSGTTLRMLLPVMAVLKNRGSIVLSHQLNKRPIDCLIDTLKVNGCDINKSENKIDIYSKVSGNNFTLPGDISSQFISGLLFALPLANYDSILQITTKIQSRPYVDMSLKILKDFNIKIKETSNNNFTIFKIYGNQNYIKPKKTIVETDWSNSAFWIVANFIGSNIKIDNLNYNSLQGDKAIVDIIKKFKTSNTVNVNLSDIPDLLPILTVCASYRKSRAITRFNNIKRLRIKESDRILSSYQMIKNLGGNINIEKDEIIIKSNGFLKGGIVDSLNDHRIAMAAAIAATGALDNIIIKNAQAVKKSYIRFFEDYEKLGGEIVKL